MNKKFKGVIFDFNGTMIFDTDIHRSVWLEYMPKLTGRPITVDEIDHNMIGVDNANIFRKYLGADLSMERIDQLAYDKEAAYREKCCHDPVRARLVDGLEDFLNYLKDNNIPRTIATGSEVNNLNFYFEIFDLARWFDYDKVVYDDGTFRGKPEPDVYLKAAERIGADPADCVVFEDATSGVIAAHRAGIGQVVAILPGFSKEYFSNFGGVTAVLPDFRSAAAVLGL